MKIEQAKEIVCGIGSAYFYDDLDCETPGEIVERMVCEISSATKLVGIQLSETQRDAYLQVVQSLSQEEMDHILNYHYALRPEKVGGGMAFFQLIAIRIDEAIQKVKPTLNE